jgi:superfamily II DNA or RNA helicase
MKNRRFFNQNERDLLYRMARGKCQMCGMELYGVFEADHVMPYSLGGKTDIINGQVLCKECNVAKGAKIVNLPEWTGKDRQWHKDAFRHYLKVNNDDFLLVATPGAGKTYFCLKVAHSMLSDGVVDQIAIVVPSDSLKTQWRNAAAEFGINICTDYVSSRNLPTDMHGVATTYQAVASRDGSERVAYRLYTSKARTLVIFDEIHHAGDGLSWGSSIRNAFECAHKRLSVTGTPFRSDSTEIPFVEYTNEDGVRTSQSDFAYSYTEALRDGVVRPVFFNTYDGDLTWMSKDEEYTADFRTELSRDQSRKRLNTALDTKGDWLTQVLSDANQQLKEIRTEHPSAGGLVVAKDKNHANAIADKLKKISSARVTVVTYDIEGASNEIESFANGSDEWIVAVKMVSEGIDIKRLRICVYATNVSTELFFRQVIGRVVRVIPGIEEQFAYVYIPQDPTIAGYAEKFKQERAHALEEQLIEELLDEVDDLRKAEGVYDPSDFQPVGSIARIDNIIIGDEVYTQQELQKTDQILIENGLFGQIKTVLAAKLLRHAGIQYQAPVPLASAQVSKKALPLEEQKKRLTSGGGAIRKAIAELIEASNRMVDWPDINRQLNWAQDVQTQKECTLEQLKDRVEVIKAWTEAYKNGTGREFTAKRYLRERAGGSFT